MNRIKWVIFPVGMWWAFKLVASNGTVMLRSSKKNYASRRSAQVAIGTLTRLVIQKPIITFEDKDNSVPF